MLQVYNALFPDDKIVISKLDNVLIIRSIFINDVDTRIEYTLSIFVYNTKIGGAMDCLEDREAL